MKSIITSLAVAFAVTVSATAQSYYLAGDFNGWVNNANPMTASGDHFDYTVTGQTPGALGNVKVTDGTWDHTWPGNNMTVRYDASGSVTVHFYPGSIEDGWIPLANRVGWDDPGNLATWGLAGDFDGWDGTQMQLAPLGGGVFSNRTTVATAQTSGFKFQNPAGQWDTIYFGSDFGNNGGNGSFTTTNSPQTLPVVLDLPKGRYLIGSLAPKPVTNMVVFAVNMAYQKQLGLFHDGSGVFVAGDFNGWPGTGPTALPLTNSSNDIYYGTNIFVGLPGSSVTHYKFTQNDASAQNSGWETSSDRNLILLATNGTIVLPAAVFSELYSSDVLSGPTPVTFRVDMTGAVGTDSHTFDPNADGVYVNGIFSSWYAWAGGVNPAPAPPGYQLFRDGTSSVFTNTIIMAAGSPVGFEYKYGIDPGNVNGGPLDNEAGFAQNHLRVVRSTVTSPYVLPVDTFANQHHEPYFTSTATGEGKLAMGQRSGSTVPVTWYGRPGLHLQFKTNLSSGSWTDLPNTDGTTWSAGVNTADGLQSVTNWPAVGTTYFRLIKQ